MWRRIGAEFVFWLSIASISAFWSGCGGGGGGGGGGAPLAAATLAKPLTGTWLVTIQEANSSCVAEVDPQELDLTFEQNGTEVTITSPNFTAIGTITGTSVDFTYTVDDVDGTREFSGTLNLASGALELQGQTAWVLLDQAGIELCSGADDWSGGKTDGDGTLSGLWDVHMVTNGGTCFSESPPAQDVLVEISQVGEEVTVDLCVDPGQEAQFGVACVIDGTVAGDTVSVNTTIDQTGGSIVLSGELIPDAAYATFTAGVDATVSITFGQLTQECTLTLELDGERTTD